MKTKQFILLLSTTAILGACVATAPPRPFDTESYSPYYATGYLTVDGLDMDTPVYVAAYPDYTFYHRYDPACDCVRIVRMLDIGGTRYWLDHTGQRVHEGRWEPARPSPHALRGYREWSHQHQTEFHHKQPPRRVEPPQPAPRPSQFLPSTPQPLVPEGRREMHRDGENGGGIFRKAAPAPKPGVAKKEDKGSTQKPRRKDAPMGRDVPTPKPAPAVKPAPATKPAPAAKTGEKPGSRGDHEHHLSDKPQGAQK